jgi:hypothetical protein
MALILAAASPIFFKKKKIVSTTRGFMSWGGGVGEVYFIFFKNKNKQV